MMPSSSIPTVVGASVFPLSGARCTSRAVPTVVNEPTISLSRR